MRTNQATAFGAKDVSSSLLKASSIIWFCVALFGWAFFAYYIAVFFGGKAMEMDWQEMTRHMIVGIVDGDTFGNFNLLLHLALAFWITVAGPLQFIPAIRRRFPTLHRWNGRSYVIIAVIITLGALYLTWARGMVGPVQQIAISINAVLILIFAGFAVRAAFKRDFQDHHRWALRLLIAVSGVWFFRIGFGFWLVATGGTMPGVGAMLDGPFDFFLVFGNYLVPLLFLEVYQHARDKGGAAMRYAASGLTLVGAGITAMGIQGAAILFWLPRLTG